MSDTPAVPEVDPVEAERRAREGAVLLDVREDDEWAAGRAPGAVHIPLGEVGDRQAELPRDTPIIAICRAGGRSEKATVALRQAGYDATNMAGGMRSWAAAGLPVVNDTGGRGQVI